jgi:tail-anchored protein insertion receptor
MFWLPHDWFPGYAEWLISFPRAPIGSVSITSWQLACTGVLVLLKDTMLALVALVQEAKAKAKAPTKEKNQKEAPVAADAAPKKKSEKAAAAGKDEL